MTIGLALYLFVVEILWIRTKNPDYSKIYRLISHILPLVWYGGSYWDYNGFPIRNQLGTICTATSNVLGGFNWV